MLNPSVSVIGAGRVGGALALALGRAGWRLAAVSCRTAASGRRAARLTGAPVLPVAEAAARGDVVLVTVPDDAVGAVARTLAGAVKRGTIVVHTSGSLTSEALAPVRRAGARAASMHPLMTVPNPRRAQFRGAHFFLEGDPGTAPVLRRLVRAVGGVPVAVSRRAKVLYHAGAVLACNDLIALLAEAFALFAKAGVPRRAAAAALGPLVRRTVDNVVALGPRAALTGPVARGDAGTVALHLKHLRGRARELYLALGRATLDLARLPAARRRTMAGLLGARG